MLRREFIGASAAAAIPLRPVEPPRSCIVIVMSGGASQLDTFDPKPDAPSDVRGPFGAIRTNAPEIRITEIFPRLAKQAHRFSLLRSMYHPGELLHDEALDLALGGTFCPERLTAQGHDKDRARYGHTAFGDQCLAARQRIESGPATVTLNMFETVFGTPSWDNHGYQPFSTMATYRDHLGPVFDMAASALIADLADRGLLETTLLVALTEFGRTPKINPQGGRDHWPGCWTTLLAGGGIEGGQILGNSDKTATEPRDNPTTPSMLLELISRTTTSRIQS
jgi:hypothetical protein